MSTDCNTFIYAAPVHFATWTQSHSYNIVPYTLHTFMSKLKLVISHLTVSWEAYPAYLLFCVSKVITINGSQSQQHMMDVCDIYRHIMAAQFPRDNNHNDTIKHPGEGSCHVLSHTQSLSSMNKIMFKPKQF